MMHKKFQRLDEEDEDCEEEENLKEKNGKNIEDFLQQFALAVIPEIRDKYFVYEELCDLIKNSLGDDECDDYFYQELELSYHLCKNYAEQWLHNLMLKGEGSGNILKEVMELNGFISINQQALQKIIFYHDLIFTTSKLFLSWRYDHVLTSLTQPLGGDLISTWQTNSLHSFENIFQYKPYQRHPLSYQHSISSVLPQWTAELSRAPPSSFLVCLSRRRVVCYFPIFLFHSLLLLMSTIGTLSQRNIITSSPPRTSCLSSSCSHNISPPRGVSMFHLL
jgi:hypothetical protein